jgi:RHH-type transcriptional regulator, rel operon repressor / antitoxin RelB
MLSVRLPEDLEARFEQFVASHDQPKSFYVKQAIASFLDDMEDMEDAKARLLDPNAEYYTTDELLRSLHDV